MRLCGLYGERKWENILLHFSFGAYRRERYPCEIVRGAQQGGGKHNVVSVLTQSVRDNNCIVATATQLLWGWCLPEADERRGQKGVGE